MAEKLTKAQERLLKDLATGGESVADDYKPALALVAHGLAEWSPSERTFGNPTLYITAAGRARLATGG